MASSQAKAGCEYSSGKTLGMSRNSVSPLPVENVVQPLPNVDNAGDNGPNSKRKRSRWHILKLRHTEQGVVPIDENHSHYKLLGCIREGLKQVLVHRPDVGAKSVLTSEDFKHVIRTHGNYEGQEFEFESFASSVFTTLRQAIRVDEQQYYDTMVMSSLPYLEFISNSRSGQDFFFSYNMQFIFKSNRSRDVNFFLSFLPKYIQHFISYPHSLLVKYIGCYMIKLKGSRKKYFLAMHSIFYPVDRIEDRFDIKGCTAGRYQKPRDPRYHNVTIYKDQNFLNEELHFGDQGEWFLQQIRVDSQFLCDLNCMDYSLLIGRQTKLEDEKGPDSVATVLERVGRSISPIKRHKNPAAMASKQYQTSGDIYDETNSNNNDIKSNKSTTNPEPGQTVLSSESLEEVPTSAVIIPSMKPGIMFPRDLADGVCKFQEEHRRLLPRCLNELHIIDGQECRYFLGIVDFLTRFDWRMKIAQYWKMIKYRCGDHSTKRPDVYQHRFVSFLSSKVI